MNQKGYINDELKNVWIRMVGFRNTLVHDYVEIDRKIVFDTLQNNLDDFKQIEKALACFPTSANQLILNFISTGNATENY